MSEVKKASSGVGSETEKITAHITNSTYKLTALASETVKYNSKAGNALTSVRRGYTDLGQAITEVWKNGQKVSYSATVSNDLRNANELYREQSNLLKELYSIKEKMVFASSADELSRLQTQEQKTQSLIDENSQLIGLVDQRIVSQTKLVGLTAEEQKLKEKLVKIQNQQQKNADNKYVVQTKKAYQQLTESYRQYNTAVKNGNQQSAAYWKQSIDGAIRTLDGLEKIASRLDEESEARKQIINLIQKSKDAQDAQEKSAKKYQDTADKIVNRMIQMASTMLIMRGLSSIWSSAKDYAQKYYDKLNEIRIVTMATEEDANRMGTSYRKMARDMKVSSTEIVSAATEFWRQGLDESDVNAR